MTLDQHPIFGLIRRIPDDDIARELSRFASFYGLETVEGLARYSKRQLLLKDVTPATVGALERRLNDDYGIGFAVSVEVSAPASVPVSEPEPEWTPVKEFTIEEREGHLVVNNEVILYGQKPKSLSPETVKQIYTLFAAGQNNKQISAAINSTTPTIDRYLRLAKLIPPEGNRKLYHSHRAGGAPPSSLFTYVSRPGYRG